ncbi:MAG: hypothetical protein U0587_06345 [Candidatus Binatia bacterium]
MPLVISMLAAVAIFALAARGARPRPANLVLATLVLLGTVLMLSHAQVASGTRHRGEDAVPVTAADELAQARRMPAPTLVPTRPPYATQTPIVS